MDIKKLDREEREERIKKYIKRYIIVQQPPRGPKRYPRTFEELANMIKADYWDQDIAGMVCADKPMALCDYYPEGSMAFEDYWEDKRMDVSLRLFAKREMDIKTMNIDYGEGSVAKIWYKPQYKENAKLLQALQLQKSPDKLTEPIRSILLGYTRVSYVCYQIYDIIMPQLMKIDAFKYIKDIDGWEKVVVNKSKAANETYFDALDQYKSYYESVYDQALKRLKSCPKFVPYD